jgi:hypothetical protein
VVRFAETWHRRLTVEQPGDPVEGLRLHHGALLLRALEVRGALRDGALGRAARQADPAAAIAAVFEGARGRFGDVFAAGRVGSGAVEGFQALIEALSAPGMTRALAAAPIEALGQAYEQCLAVSRGGARKAAGVYYTPPAIARGLVEKTVGALIGEGREPASLRIIDPACGAGAFLVGAYDRLLAGQLEYLLGLPESERGDRVVGAALGVAERRRILETCLFGIDLDPHALEVARLSLVLRMLEGEGDRLAAPMGGAALGERLVVGDALAVSWVRSMPLHPDPPPAERGDGQMWRLPGGGFDVVIGNPPWGQKAIEASEARKRELREAYPSCRGIFDWFRPFVELGVRLVRSGGAWGMVLPDIVLLKNYEPTRRLLLEELALTEIEWLGMAFDGAVIDAVTIAGRKRPAATGHRVHVVVSEPASELDHGIRQADFLANPRCTFNLLLTAERRGVLDRLAGAPRLGDFFEAHEGIHSGNIRSELFVASRVDESCRELIFGRDELRPHVLRWNGRFVRLSAVPARRSRERYANLGRREWHEQDKVLVRRTGDRIIAAVDGLGRFASNNFFLITPHTEHLLSLHGLSALLNSALMTWIFRAVEPRKGRAFAEVKIKHLVDLPIPSPGRSECKTLNALGEERATSGNERAAELDAAIDAAALALFGLEDAPLT